MTKGIKRLDLIRLKYSYLSLAIKMSLIFETRMVDFKCSAPSPVNLGADWQRSMHEASIMEGLVQN